MYAPPQLLQTEVFTRMPEQLYRFDKPSEWVDNRESGPLHSFLEGPSFDRGGNLFCVDLAHSRLFKISPQGEWSVFVEYDGEPNGLKIHKDGRVFVADHKLGLLSFDPVTAKMTVVLDRPFHERFKGLNDLHFASNGDLYFTDQGKSSLHDPSGRVFRLRPDGQLDLVADGFAGPNGLVLNAAESTLYVAETRMNRIVAIPFRADGRTVSRIGVYIQLSGSPNGPDGLALDQAGTVWLFSNMGEPIYRIKSCTGLRTTNVAFGGAGRRILYITEAEQAAILKVQLPVAGKLMYGLQ